VGNHFRSDLLSDASSNELRKPRGIRALEPSQGGLGRRDFVSVVDHILGPATNVLDLFSNFKWVRNDGCPGRSVMIQRKWKVLSGPFLVSRTGDAG